VWTKNSEEILEKAQILVHIRSVLHQMQQLFAFVKQAKNGR
jgi:hypothetical protein